VKQLTEKTLSVKEKKKKKGGGESYGKKVRARVLGVLLSEGI